MGWRTLETRAIATRFFSLCTFADLLEKSCCNGQMTQPGMRKGMTTCLSAWQTSSCRSETVAFDFTWNCCLAVYFRICLCCDGLNAESEADLQINTQKRKTGIIAPKRFVQRVKRDNELFRGYMHQASIWFALVEGVECISLPVLRPLFAWLCHHAVSLERPLRAQSIAEF